MPPVILRIDEQAPGIPGIRCRRSAHGAERVVGKQLWRVPETVDVNEERRQLTRRRKPAAVGIHSGNIHPVRIAIAPSLTIIFYLVDRAVRQRVPGNPHVDYSATL